jgi:hypothetical protein
MKASLDLSILPRKTPDSPPRSVTLIKKSL